MQMNLDFKCNGRLSTILNWDVMQSNLHVQKVMLVVAVTTDLKSERVGVDRPARKLWQRSLGCHVQNRAEGYEKQRKINFALLLSQ